ncbi:hypothetical protein MUN89_00590 [Halobacillus salinarum]|uniref:Uncharacterized protein n=1 Tax=Halobacillus salinarum TaxID=2932257 RepID=A0ABY4EJ87_9BACI|nr:hypothetical protein [Halobacillus salinarum]UOQ44527.1 hypothetical protein MUN89_00590 [Halobacillus salinarum]
METLVRGLKFAVFTSVFVPVSLAAVAVAAIVTHTAVIPILIVLAFFFLLWLFLYYILVSRLIDELDDPA